MVNEELWGGGVEVGPESISELRDGTRAAVLHLDPLPTQTACCSLCNSSLTLCSSPPPTSCTEGGIQGPMHAWQALYHWIMFA